MSILKSIKLKFLNSSDSYNYYKSKSLNLENNQKKIETNNRNLKKEIHKLKKLMIHLKMIKNLMIT